VIANNLARKDKTLWTENAEGEQAAVYRAWDEHEEANFVAQTVLAARAQGAPWDEIAVFYRTNAQSRVLEDALRRGGIPYVIVGSVRFYERREIKDALAWLRLIVNPADDVAFRRAVQAPGRGIGRTTLVRLDEVATREGRGLLSLAAAPPADITGKPGRALEDFTALIATLAARREGTTLPAFIDEVLNASGYREDLKQERSAEAEARLENLEELIAAAEDHARTPEGATLEGFLDGIALVSDVDEWKDDARGITLMTLHSAKGLEFPRVYLVGVEEGILPHARAVAENSVEEERRLMYVGITRAQRHLTVLCVRSRARYGHRGECMPSRFLYEMRGEAPPKGWKACGA
jgi:DNA helicase-2/ATP-dependent DNA helicase PcrA